MLVHGTQAARDHFMEGRSRAERRRLERTAAQEADEQRRFAGKLTTRADVLRILELYVGQKIVPLAANVDANTAALRYLTAPWWKRRLIDCRRIGGAVLHWLSERGIRFHRLDEEDTDGEDDDS